MFIRIGLLERCFLELVCIDGEPLSIFDKKRIRTLLTPVMTTLVVTINRENT